MYLLDHGQILPRSCRGSSRGRPRVLPDYLVLTNSTVKPPRAGPSRPTDLASIIQPQSPDPSTINETPPLPPLQVADELLDAFYRHTQSRYPYVDWIRLREWHAERDLVCTSPGHGQGDREVGSFFIWMTYAIGAQLVTRHSIETPASYFQQACKHMDAALALSNLTSVRALLFVLFYAFRSQSGPPLYLFSGHVMRLCLEFNLHRRATPGTDPLMAETRKRIFWSAYCLDRLIGLASGRPFCVSDHDIDIELPVDIDVDNTDPHAILQLQQGAPSPYGGRETNMTSAIHIIRHYQYRSKAHTTLYARNVLPPTQQVVTDLLSELEEWRRQIPNDTTSASQSQLKFQMMYFQAVLLTLRPAVVHAGPRDPVLLLCASVAAESCEVSQRLT